ncbi:esterase family protein [Bergeriella denitrificans]|uniref:Uncharacterized protein conserved in bacteria n=1 Tax=Bergeriella denitrificans TaxID=494 RepID=A0A378UE65_BERDE|nr:alpha/beta hydrolase-fold protein [Bergeriella denitrificans]STZ75656.1 Uncharacterized protein conserved in bacteria [Bergeriella denitrificans]
MHFEARSHWSGELGREMPFNVYGHAGKPVIVFPSSGGNHHEYGNFGMIEACAPFIESGRLTFYTPDSADKDSWLDTRKSGHDMALAHNAYDRYIINELVPLIRSESAHNGALMATGCSMGAFHTVNFALRHPDVFDTAVALSGVYDARFFSGEFHGDPEVYTNSPIDFLWGQHDAWFLERYRRNHFITAVGQGAWEEQHIADTRRLQEAFAAKGIDAWFDYWGHDMAHDWPLWRLQMPYFLGILAEQNLI